MYVCMVCNWYKTQKNHTMTYVIGSVTLVTSDFIWNTCLTKNRQKMY